VLVLVIVIVIVIVLVIVIDSIISTNAEFSEPPEEPWTRMDADLRG
jgi:hypothetical protein